MKKKHSYNIAIIGLGKVGTAIGHLLKKSGHEIIAISDKSAAALKKALPYTGGKTFRDPKKAVVKADVILITTPDDAIFNACNEISDSQLVKDKFVFHMSGAGGLDLLDSAKSAGAVIAGIHPLQSFSSVDNAIINIPGSVFGITADKKAGKQAKIIVRDLGGIPVLVSPDQKPLYHAAACFASNYLVSLLNVVESIYRSVGIKEANARRAYLPLIYGTLKNIEASDPVLALTGPIARGDISTIQKHISAIDEQIPKYSLLYSVLGLIATDIAQKKGTLSSKKAKKITDLLKGVIDHEHTK
jgi:predicted short-subunit dehydrogenase-like oxidoreductase (DUF2520 family)